MTDRQAAPRGPGVPAGPDAMSGNTVEPPDDAMIAGLVRDVAAGWSMPPRRLGAPTWREIVEQRSDRGAGPGRWRRRLGAAASTALVGTVVVALVAVWLSSLRSGPPAGAASPGASAGGGPGPATGAPATPGTTPGSGATPPATPLPALTVFGDPLPGTSLIVSAGTGERVADVSAGTLGDVLVRSDQSGNELSMLPDGRAVCLCATESIDASGTTLSLELRFVAADGSLERTIPVGTYTGTSTAAPDTAVLVEPTLSPDGRRFLVGWTAAASTGWRSGIDIVDLGTGALTRGATLPALPLTNDGTIPGGAPADGSRVYSWAPEVRVSPDGRRLIVAHYVTINEQIEVLELYAASLSGSAIGRPAPLATGSGTLDECAAPLDGAFASNDVFGATCTLGSKLVLRRVAPDGSPLGDTELSTLGIGQGAFFGSASVATSSAGVAYLWDAFSRTVVSVDRASGDVVGRAVLPAPTAAAGDPLAALGRVGRTIGSWLAPAALAKLYLDPAIALSPDGGRLYLIGTSATDFTDVGAASTGVWVLDASSLAVLDRWPPTADFVSVAVSGDGRFVYAAGMPGVGPDGGSAPFEASITVFDAATGRVRAVAGALGTDWLMIRGVLRP